MEKHIEETPEMAKIRKAKAALKNSQSNIAEIVSANDGMSARMVTIAGELERLSKTVGGGICVKGYFSNLVKNNTGGEQTVSLSTLLMAAAERLREKAV